MSLNFKEKFIERYSNLTDFNLFAKYCNTFLRRSIRVNTLKISVEKLKDRLSDTWELKQIPWCKEGFWIENKKEKRRDIGNLAEHALGYFYVQEAASMIPAIVLNARDSVVLDMAAAPGSKTTQIAAMVNNKGIIVANDFDYKRIKALSINLERCGVLNNVITLMNAKSCSKFSNYFDYVLLDAPCSGTGTIRKSIKTIEMWNPNMVKRLANEQKRLIEVAFNCLKQNGTLVYSTCSLEPEEDEGVINFLLNKFDNAKLDKIELNINRSKTVEEFGKEKYNSEVRECLRIWPQDNDTDGFFVTKILKN